MLQPDSGHQCDRNLVLMMIDDLQVFNQGIVDNFYFIFIVFMFDAQFSSNFMIMLGFWCLFDVIS